MPELPTIDPRLVHLHRQVRAHFGPELTSAGMLVNSNSVRGTLYDAIVFTCGIDAQTGAFGAAILLTGNEAVHSVFGEPIARDRAPEAVARSLDLIHEYARLSLPEAYLDRFAQGVAARDAQAAIDAEHRAR